MTRAVSVVRTGVANLASVLAGLARADGSPELTEDPDVVRRAERVMLPGVGAFGAAMAELRSRGLDEALRERVAAGRPTLGICLGLQLFALDSEESPGVPGLGLVPARVLRFESPGLRVPQLGWNRVVADPACRFLTDGYAYFANSFRLTALPAGWRGALSQHGGPLVAAMERADVLLCQFHPELSGAYGRGLLARWLDCGASS